jgi:hypothetical protein
MAKEKLPQELARLDSRSALVVAFPLSTLQDLRTLAKRTFPGERGSLDLVELGALAFLGFTPLQNKGWRSAGFDPNTAALIQAPIFDSNSNTWHSRLVLQASNAKAARKALAGIRFRLRSTLDESSNESTRKILNAKSQTLKAAARSLQSHGVFLIARPTPLSGLLAISQHGSVFVVDLFVPSGGAPRPWSESGPPILGAIGRQKKGLPESTPLLHVLSGQGVRFWMHASNLGRDLMIQSNVRRRRSCSALAEQVQQSSIEVLGGGLQLHKGIELELLWGLTSGNALAPILTTAEAPLVQTDKNANLMLRVDWNQIGALRTLKRQAGLATWDTYVHHTRRCGPFSEIVLMALSAPELGGLFLDEVSRLHPQARALVDSLGPFQVRTQHIPKHRGAKQGRDVLTMEGWISKPGNQFAKAWLQTLFGKASKEVSITRWGLGRIRPYGIDLADGSIVGADFDRIVTSSKEKRAAASSGLHLLQLRARPRKLVPAPWPLTLPWPDFWRFWKHLRADLVLKKSAQPSSPGSDATTTLHFTLRLDRH